MYDPLLYVQFPYLWQTLVSLVQSSFSVQSVIFKINVLGYKDIFEADMMNLFLQSGVSASAACFLMFCRTVDLSSYRIYLPKAHKHASLRYNHAGQSGVNVYNQKMPIDITSFSSNPA